MELVKKAEWLGGRDCMRLKPVERLVLQHMARMAVDNAGIGLGDRRYGETKQGKPAQLYTQSQANAVYELGMNARQYMQAIADLSGKGILERMEASKPGRSASYRLHVAELYDIYKVRESGDPAAIA